MCLFFHIFPVLNGGVNIREKIFYLVFIFFIVYSLVSVSAIDVVKEAKENNLIACLGHLEKASYGQEVIDLQKWLKANKYYNGKIDGYFGVDTETALIMFEKDNNTFSGGKISIPTKLSMVEKNIRTNGSHVTESNNIKDSINGYPRKNSLTIKI